MEFSSGSSLPDLDKPIDRRGTGSVKWDGTGDGILPMWVADMDLPSPPEVTEALRERVSHPVYGYTLVPDGYYESCAEFMLKIHRRRIEKDEILPSIGVMPALRAAIDAFTDPGDSVLIPSPVYPPFFHAVKSKNRVALATPLVRVNSRYVFDFERFEDRIEAGTRMVLLCSPHNPVGRVWTPDELATLGEICVRRDLVIVSDEIHADILLPGSGFAAIADVTPEIADRTVSLVSPSKTFNIPGVSTAVALIRNREMRKRMSRALAAAGVHHPSLFGILASETAWRHGLPWLEQVRRYLAANLENVYAFGRENFESVEVTRQDATFISWIDFRPYLDRVGMTDQELHRLLRVEGRVELSYGTEFGPGGEGFMRLNFGTANITLREGLERITRFLLRRGGPEA